MLKNPLGEVFGFPVDNMTDEAVNHRQGRLCPFHNSSGMNCTKVSVINPLGVCSILENGKLVVTCPVRFREGFQIVSDAAEFFFPGQKYVAITEARLKDRIGKSAGNIDISIVAVDKDGAILDFGAVEVQAVYISGNVRKVFDKYMQDPQGFDNDQQKRSSYPRPDYLSSSRKRLAPQLIFKGGILHKWGKSWLWWLMNPFSRNCRRSRRSVETRQRSHGWFTGSRKRTADTFYIEKACTLHNSKAP